MEQKKFVYEFKSKKGELITAEIIAKDLNSAKTLLRKQGVAYLSVKPKSRVKSGGQVNAKDLAIFSRQIATMLSSGIALTQALNIIVEGAEKQSYRELVRGLKSELESGKSFSAALNKYPLFFDELFCSLVAAGEQSGSLEKMLDQIAIYKERTESIKKKIKKAMYYPIAILCISFIVTGILLVKVVPSFSKLFDNFGAKLPEFTLMVLRLSDFVRSKGYMILIGLVSIISTVMYLYKRNIIFRHLMQRLLLKIPILGDIIDKAAIARFARTLSTTFAAGVPLNEALVTVAKASGNIVYEKAINVITETISSGQSLNVAMQRSGIFPIMVIQMIAVGEESGSLEKMLDKVANIFEEEVNLKVDGLTSLLEPLIMAFLGIVVGGLVVAMYLPIFKLGSIMS